MFRRTSVHLFRKHKKFKCLFYQNLAKHNHNLKYLNRLKSNRWKLFKNNLDNNINNSRTHVKHQNLIELKNCKQLTPSVFMINLSAKGTYLEHHLLTSWTFLIGETNLRSRGKRKHRNTCAKQRTDYTLKELF